MVSFAVQKILFRFHLFIFVFIFITLGGGPKNILLQFMSYSRLLSDNSVLTKVGEAVFDLSVVLLRTMNLREIR